MPLAKADERAGLLWAFYVAGYLSFSRLPFSRISCTHRRSALGRRCLWRRGNRDGARISARNELFARKGLNRSSAPPRYTPTLADQGTPIMTTKPMKLPGTNHPIAIEPNPARVVVSVAGHIIANTREALTLREASYPAVQYVPRKDVDMSLLKRTEHATYCPYKGDCAYYSIPMGGERSSNAVWT